MDSRLETYEEQRVELVEPVWPEPYSRLEAMIRSGAQKAQPWEFGRRVGFWRRWANRDMRCEAEWKSWLGEELRGQCVVDLSLPEKVKSNGSTNC